MQWIKWIVSERCYRLLSLSLSLCQLWFTGLIDSSILAHLSFSFSDSKPSQIDFERLCLLLSLPVDRRPLMRSTSIQWSNSLCLLVIQWTSWIDFERCHRPLSLSTATYHGSVRVTRMKWMISLFFFQWSNVPVRSTSNDVIDYSFSLYQASLTGEIGVDTLNHLSLTFSFSDPTTSEINFERCYQPFSRYVDRRLLVRSTWMQWIISFFLFPRSSRQLRAAPNDCIEHSLSLLIALYWWDRFWHVRPSVSFSFSDPEDQWTSGPVRSTSKAVIDLSVAFPLRWSSFIGKIDSETVDHFPLSVPWSKSKIEIDLQRWCRRCSPCLSGQMESLLSTSAIQINVQEWHLWRSFSLFWWLASTVEICPNDIV